MTHAISNDSPAAPTAATPRPASAPATPMTRSASSPVPALAITSAICGAIGVLAAVLLALLALLMPAALFEQIIGAAMPPLAATLASSYRHLLPLALAGLAASLALIWLGWGLWRRREGARRVFIAALLLSALANFAALPLLDAIAPLLQDGLAIPDLERSQWQALTAAFTRTLFWSALLGAIALAALHGWIAWVLCRPRVRAEFRDCNAD